MWDKDKGGWKNCVAHKKQQQKIFPPTILQTCLVSRDIVWGIFRKSVLHKKQFFHWWPDYAVSLKAHLDQHVLREGVEVVASVLLRVALSSAAGAYYHPIVVKAFKEKSRILRFTLTFRKNSITLKHRKRCKPFVKRGTNRGWVSRWDKPVCFIASFTVSGCSSISNISASNADQDLLSVTRLDWVNLQNDWIIKPKQCRLLIMLILTSVFARSKLQTRKNKVRQQPKQIQA